MRQVAPPSVVIVALPPPWAIANQAFRVAAASPASTKKGYQDTPPAGNPAPPTSRQVSPPSVVSTMPSASCSPLIRWVGSWGSTASE
jgi:hypothetical protein